MSPAGRARQDTLARSLSAPLEIPAPFVVLTRLEPQPKCGQRRVRVHESVLSSTWAEWQSGIFIRANVPYYHNKARPSVLYRRFPLAGCCHVRSRRLALSPAAFLALGQTRFPATNCRPQAATQAKRLYRADGIGLETQASRIEGRVSLPATSSERPGSLEAAVRGRFRCCL